MIWCGRTPCTRSSLGLSGWARRPAEQCLGGTSMRGGSTREKYCPAAEMCYGAPVTKVISSRPVEFVIVGDGCEPLKKKLGRRRELIEQDRKENLLQMLDTVPAQETYGESCDPEREQGKEDAELEVVKRGPKATAVNPADTHVENTFALLDDGDEEEEGPRRRTIAPLRLCLPCRPH